MDRRPPPPPSRLWPTLLAPLPFRPSRSAWTVPGAPARPALASLAGIVLLACLPACGPQEDWSPLDGPWDPEHPDAIRILEAPEPESPVDPDMARAGERWYRTRGCLACHPVHGSDAVGPALGGIERRRDYEWFRAMVLRPDSMLRVDPVARELLAIYRVPMPDQGASELETRAMWEYLRGEEP